MPCQAAHIEANAHENNHVVDVVYDAPHANSHFQLGATFVAATIKSSRLKSSMFFVLAHFLVTSHRAGFNVYCDYCTMVFILSRRDGVEAPYVRQAPLSTVYYYCLWKRDVLSTPKHSVRVFYATMLLFTVPKHTRERSFVWQGRSRKMLFNVQVDQLLRGEETKSLILFF